MIEELDTVVLTRPLAGRDLERGDIGAVACRHPGGEEFEVEFAAGHGDTVAVLTLPRGDIRPMEGREILHARPIERQSG